MKIFPPISLFYNVSMGKIEITLWHTIIGLWDSLGLHFILLGIRGSLKFSKHGCSVFLKKKSTFIVCSIKILTLAMQM
jgi:hypothetical protein